MQTRDNLIRHATELVRRTGFAGFSYADLSAAAGLRKASIHHHFPAKVDLGVEIVEHYRKSFADELAAIEARESSARRRLAEYAALYRQGVGIGTSCLCGVLAAEFDGLPGPVQSAVRAFFDDNVAWLENILREGRRQGEVGGRATATRQARMVVAALQGAMLLARANGGPRVFDDAIEPVLSTLLD